MGHSGSHRAPARRSRSARRWLGILGVLLIMVGLALAALALKRAQSPSDVGVEVRPRATPSSSSVGVESEPPATTGEPSAPAALPARGVPVSLTVPRLGVAAPVIRIAMTPNTELTPPDNPGEVGWWGAGARPGAAYGSALIIGHAVHTGGGAFNNLAKLDRGDTVRVRTRRGIIRYGVRSVRIYRKSSLARDAQKLFSQSVPGRLVLVTCEDWNGETWLSNAVVTATPKHS